MFCFRSQCATDQLATVKTEKFSLCGCSSSLAAVVCFTELPQPITLVEAPYAENTKHYKTAHFNQLKKVVDLLSTTFFKFYYLQLCSSRCFRKCCWRNQRRENIKP